MFSKAEGEAKSFAFDKVFQSCSSQAEVYEDISQLVQSALDGYKVQNRHLTSHFILNTLPRSPFLHMDKLVAARHTQCLAASATTCRAKA